MSWKNVVVAMHNSNLAFLSMVVNLDCTHLGVGWATMSSTWTRCWIIYQNASSLLSLNILGVRLSGQPIIVVHSQVDVNVDDGTDVIHEKKRPHLISAERVSLEEASICWKPSIPPKGQPSYGCVATINWVLDNVKNAAISIQWVVYLGDPWRSEQRSKPSPCVCGGPNGSC